MNREYYDILNIPYSATTGDVTRAYRRLALATHPDGDLGIPMATASFQKIVQAYETLSDPVQRVAYDNFAWPHFSSYARPAQAETQDRHAGSSHDKQKANDKPETDKPETQHEGLDKLKERKRLCENKVLEASEAIKRISLELDRLEKEEKAAALREGQKRDGWWSLFVASLGGQSGRDPEERRRRRNERIHRLAVKELKEKTLQQKEAGLTSLKHEIRGLDREIAAGEREMQNETRSGDEDTRRRQQQQQPQQPRQREQGPQSWVLLELHRRLQREWDRKQQDWMDRVNGMTHGERYLRAIREEREDQESRMRLAFFEKQEREEEERRARKQERKERSQAGAAEVARFKAREGERKEGGRGSSNAKKHHHRHHQQQQQQPSTHHHHHHHRRRRLRTPSKAGQETCGHDAFWPKLRGRHVCSRCGKTQKKFALRCPMCQLVTCAWCCKALRDGEGEDRE